MVCRWYAPRWPVDPAACGLFASAAALVNVALLKIATHPVDPLDIAALAQLDAGVVPWLIASLVADLAFYLLLIPVALGLGGRVARGAGVIYALVGAVGAALLLWHWPASLVAADAERFEGITRVVYFDLWNGVGALAAFVWWVGVARRTRRTHRRFAALTLALGLLSLMDAVSFRLVSLEAARWVLMAVLALLVVWPAAAALGPLRSQAQHQPQDATERH